MNGHTDLFALDATLSEPRTGEKPFRGHSMTDLMFEIANEPREPIRALRADPSEAVSPIVDKGRSKTPAVRSSDCAETAKASCNAAAASA